MTFFVTGIATITIGTTGVVTWAACFLLGFFQRRDLWYRFWRLRVLFGDGKYDSQSGEMSKDDRRQKYKKNRHYQQKKSGDYRSKKSSPAKKKKRPVPGPKQQVQYDSQSGMLSNTMTQAFEKMASMSNVPFNDDTLDKIENLAALYAIIRESVSTTQLCGALFLYFKTHYKKSAALLAAKYLGEICDMDFSTQSGDFTPRNSIFDVHVDTQSGEFDSYLKDKDKPKWLQLLKSCQENWTLVIRNEGFEKISKILSLALALGLCEASHLDFKVGGMKLFTIGAAPKQASCISLIDAVFETVVYFAEGGYACFETGSIKPLLYGNMENEHFDENYSLCQQCLDYARAGNLHLAKMDESDFAQLLDSTIEKASFLISTARGTVEKNILRRKQDALRVWQSQFNQTRIAGGLREAPYSIGVFGGTGVGKSSVANISMVTTLLHNGYVATDDRIITLNESDKYMSNYRSYINGILLDDIGNTKAAFVEKAPTTLMIQLVNNVRMYANMAEAELKGKVSVEPRVVIGTKNVKDTCATVYSNEPASITRRDRITITVRVRPEFATDRMLDSEKVKAYYGPAVPLIPDLWEITVEKSFPVPSETEGKPDKVGWRVECWNGVPLEGISFQHFIRFVAEDSKKFYAGQKKLVEGSNNMAKRMTICEKCKLVTDVCYCEPVFEEDENSESENEAVAEETDSDDVTMDTQFGTKIATAIHQRAWLLSRRYRPLFSYWLDNAEDRTVKWMIERLDWLENSPYTIWTNWIPTDWLDKPFIRNLIWATHEESLKRKILRSYWNHAALAFSIVFIAYCLTWKLLILLVVPASCASRVVECEKKSLYDQVSSDNKAMPEVFKMYRDKHIKWITGLCVSIAALYAVAQIWQALKVVPSPQANLDPSSDEEIVERDEEVNPWAGVVVAPMPSSQKSKTTTVDTLQKLVEKNLAYFEIEGLGGKKHYCNAFFPGSNIALIPNHMWVKDDLKAKFVRHEPGKIGGNFEAFLNKSQSYHIPKTDLSLVWVPNGGDWKSMLDYFPEDIFGNAPARVVYKEKEGSIMKVRDKIPKVMLTPGTANTSAGNFQGCSYKLPLNTFMGLCMATMVTETNGPMIGGFHLGGVTGHTTGCSGTLTRAQMDNAIAKLKEKPGVILSKSEGTIPTEQYGIRFYQNDEVHPKSAINFLEEGSNVKYYGQVTGRSSYHTDVVPTKISEIVADVTGKKNKWGGPKFRTGYPFQASLVHSAKPSCGIEGSLVIRAASDYVKPIVKALDKLPKLRDSIRPLTEMETVCGIDGKRFIDKLPPNTSIGYPLSGAKSKYLTLLDPEDYPDFNCPAELDSMFWKKAYEMEELYLSGERAYPIFKACLKDEPTKLSKDKVRVFHGAPVALQLLVRKYYLPVARSLSMMPLTSECAVGVNATGPEWDQLARHMKKFGEKRILAGDYSKYDLRMSAQLMFSAFRILIDMARHTGNYTERDIDIMEGLACDICYPLMAYNGDLIQHFGSNPSGQNMTVYINSIVNSLLMRCAYFEIMKDKKNVPEFRNVCSLMTYGDDVKSSVKTGYDCFNHIAVAEFLEARDMKFTMPDKESVPTPYMEDADADFLKRKNVFNTDTNLIMGALEDDSKYKSLHAVLKSKAITNEQQSMQNIDGFLRESFPLGEEYYEQHRALMQEVADRAEISHGCNMLEKSYSEVLREFKEKYT